MDPNSKIGEVLEKGQQITDTAVSDVATSVKGQIIGEKKPVANQTQQISPQPQNTPQANTDEASVVPQAEQEWTKEVVQDFYSQSDQVTQTTPAQSAANDEANLAKTREELKQYQNLHKEVYYDPLFAYENKKPEPSKAEEAEEEKQVKMQELAQKQAKKDQDIAVQRAQTTVEVNRGVSG